MKTKIYKLASSTKHGFFALVFAVFSGTVYSQATYTFFYTGSVQTLTLGLGNYEIECWGANGGDVNAGPGGGGKGGYSRGEITIVTPGTLLNILVGGKGGNASGTGSPAGSGGWNGGGGGGATGKSGGGGGGASDVRLGGLAAANRIIVAGAGGGAAYYNSLAEGGNGGGQNGSNGNIITSGNVTTIGGGGAGANGANPGMSPNGFLSTNGTATGGGGGGNSPGIGFGAQGTGGGPGGYGGANGSGSTGSSGGGGAGYAGGAGGTQTVNVGAAGGGGSSYIGGVNSGTTIMFGQPNFVNNPDATGNGRVIIRELCSISLNTNTGINQICLGASLTLTTNAISSYTWSNGSNANNIVISPSVTTTYSLVAMSPSNCITSTAITITVSPAAPVLTVTASSPSVCLGNTVSILASGALSYTWTGGITNGVAFSPTATLTYSVQGQNGCGTTSSVTTISIAPLPVVAIASPTLICAATVATLSGGGATTYTWQPGNIVGTNVLVSPQVNTTYTVTGGTGNCIGVNTVSLATNPNPTLTVSSTHFSLCAGESATLTATGGISYTWTPGGTGPSIVVSPIIPTAYNVVGVNSFGCYANTNIPVIAYAGPNMNIAASSTLVCTGGSVSLNASGANTYSWSTGAITPVTVITPVSSAVYTVVGSTPNSPCVTTKTVQVDVFTATISVSSPTAICIGESTTLNASGATTYNWSNGGSGSNVVVSPVSTTGYTVNGISTIGGTSCSSTGTTMVTVNPLPTVTASSTRTNICRFEFANITAGGASTYSWSNASTASTISVNPNTNTTYSVIGTDANGCKSSASIQIKVYQCVGISENASETNLLNVYPNPSSGEFNISANQPLSLILVNELGQLIRELELNAENNYTVEIKDLVRGVYFISSKNSDLQLYKKIVIQ